MPHQNFVVSRFKNRNGVITFRVEGRLNGVRIRKNFKSREEAIAEKGILDLQALQSSSDIQPVQTSLAAAQVREAEAAFQRLKGRAKSLAFYLDYALTNYHDPALDISLADATDAYVVLREQDHRENNLSHRQFTAYRCELRALKKAFPRITPSELTPSALIDYFKRGNASKKAYNNRRGLVGAFLKHCMLKDWVSKNIIDKVPHFRGVGHRRGSAPTLTASQCAEIMEWAEANAGGGLVPFITLCLFAGIRPDLYQGEISKLKPEHVRLDTGVIMVEPNVSKVRMKRTVTIQPNLRAWLQAYPLEKYPIWPNGFKRLRLEFRKRFNLTHDVLRHTFISMHVGKFRSLGDAALQAGNSESIIRKHYLDLKNPGEAEQFFGIFPKKQVEQTSSDAAAA
ncbi:hypothetical protein CMV30_03685 [Nibricoccus aquaticus]|uniref:Core-binding (CB) domain-containing protein n=1 Tax=Nibricoccus aquaticus TaxID=2576891 RepID=A0A290QCS4_9BACT|nr:hypothetical protein [Nibricoccus aquaticus]ATC63128.1 hypothetical protein CMV30_03685 [Nibricoccus aquaticus]